MFTSTLASLLLLPLAVSALDEGMESQYRGSFIAVKGDATESRKSFTLNLLVAKTGAEGSSLVWKLEEKGHGGWLWPDQIGLTEVDGRQHPRSPRGPALLYEREDGKSAVPLLLPVLPLPESALEKNAHWEFQKLQYTVVDSAKVQDRDCWKVEARNEYGVRRTVWVDKAQGMVVRLHERVFIGQGHEHDLRMDLEKQKKIAPNDLLQIDEGLEALKKLLTKLEREPQTTNANWKDEQLAILKADAPMLAPFAENEFIGPIVKAIELDVKNQRGRAGAVAALRDKAIGNPVGKFKLEALNSKGISEADLEGKVTVLHFWEYKDTPLEEPYGQTGYLDFFSRKQNGKPVAVYGVAVDATATDAAGKKKVAQAANRMKSFMNLSYPVLVDDGSVLKQIGDPRVAGAKLPLFVVIGKDGKILEYHSGYYEVKRDQGLEELQKIVTKAVDSRE